MVERLRLLDEQEEKKKKEVLEQEAEERAIKIKEYEEEQKRIKDKEFGERMSTRISIFLTYFMLAILALAFLASF